MSKRSGNGSLETLEAGALQHSSQLPVLAGRSPLLRLQSDEKLIAMTRRGQHGAFETLVQRYQSRLLAFCRHMLGSTEDAEDVLQEVFTAAFNAMLADERPINARPWLYRIARNRCLNHLRRPSASGQDSMDVFERDGGTTTADTVHKREEFRQIVADVQELPETQKTALLLREIDALSYEQIAEAMDTTVPSVKSLLVRARVSLGEAAEARLLSCSEVRVELGEVAEGLARTSAPVRRHLKGCERCRTFRAELRRTNRALAAVFPIGPLVALKLFVAKLGVGAAASGGSTAGSGIAASAGGAGATAGGATAGGALSAGVAGLASKAAAGIAAAALVTAGAVEVREVATHVNDERGKPAAVAVVAPRPAAPVQARASAAPRPVAVAVAAGPGPSAKEPIEAEPAVPATAAATTAPVADQTSTTTPPATTAPAADTTAPTQPEDQGSTQEDGSTVVLTPGDDETAGGGPGSSSGSGGPATPPGERAPTGPASSGSVPTAGE
ncbi:MAG TPA: sigma-70 family RNA polymerase sigma factor [Thermoleophilaceae bacterium]